MVTLPGGSAPRKLEAVEKKTCVPAWRRSSSVAQLPINDSRSETPSSLSSMAVRPTTAKRSGRRARRPCWSWATRAATCGSWGIDASIGTSAPSTPARRPSSNERRTSARYARYW